MPMLSTARAGPVFSGTNRTLGFHTRDDTIMVSDLDFEELVNLYYQPLYRFALSLTRTEADAGDLTQQTFYIYETKGHQLRDRAKVKAWLFTTMHREYLNSQRRYIRFPHVELEEAESELPAVPAEAFGQLDKDSVLEALARVDEPHQAALGLFYLEDYSYKEMADILGVPIGTIKSRLARGIAQLKLILADASSSAWTVEGKLHE
jgi:RNA polymerase sigma factor (sigma-70 family)